MCREMKNNMHSPSIKTRATHGCCYLSSFQGNPVCCVALLWRVRERDEPLLSQTLTGLAHLSLKSISHRGFFSSLYEVVLDTHVLVLGTSSLSPVPSQSFYSCIKKNSKLFVKEVFPQREGGTYGFTAATPTEWRVIKQTHGLSGKQRHSV